MDSAGILEMGGLNKFSHQAVENTIQVDLMGRFIAQESLPALKETHGQSLYFTSSSYTRGRTKAFDEEPAGTLLAAERVAVVSIDTLLSSVTGQIVDVRRRDNAPQPA